MEGFGKPFEPPGLFQALYFHFPIVSLTYFWETYKLLITSSFYLPLFLNTLAIFLFFRTLFFKLIVLVKYKLLLKNIRGSAAESLVKQISPLRTLSIKEISESHVVVLQNVSLKYSLLPSFLFLLLVTDHIYMPFYSSFAFYPPFSGTKSGSLSDFCCVPFVIPQTFAFNINFLLTVFKWHS